MSEEDEKIKKKPADTIVRASALGVCGLVLLVLLVVSGFRKWTDNGVSQEGVPQEGSGVYGSDTSEFSADPSLFHDASVEFEETPAERAEKEERTINSRLVGAWLDQDSNRREFTADGKYLVDYRDTKQSVEGTYELLANPEVGAVVLKTENPVEGAIIYSVDVVTEDGRYEDANDVTDGYEGVTGEYGIILWAEEEYDSLELRR